MRSELPCNSNTGGIEDEPRGKNKGNIKTGHTGFKVTGEKRGKEEREEKREDEMKEQGPR